ncbi:MULTISPECIES: hypothetical protein [Rhodococcus]|uniref:hypothetical protein n=1 Tax=Rhodococcus TaxID=1827 RepID=UPI000C7CBD39|nr:MULTISPECIES: hypothetical protein [Rhodococcus]AUM18252.1 hypothetical protein CSW53_18010 [Rhodococcus ruber]
MTGRIVNRTTPGLRRPTWTGYLDRIVNKTLDELMSLIGIPSINVRSWFPGDPVNKVGARWRDLYGRPVGRAPRQAAPAPEAPPRPLVCGSTAAEHIVDYPGRDALDHYARGGVIRVQRPISGPDARMADDPQPLAWSETKAQFVPSSECYWL